MVFNFRKVVILKSFDSVRARRTELGLGERNGDVPVNLV